MADNTSKKTLKPKNYDGSPIDPAVQVSLNILNVYHGARSRWAEQVVEDRDFRNGVQYTKKEEQELNRVKQAAIVVNVLHPAIESAKSMLTANQPRFNASAREGSDMKIASLYADFMSFIWDRSKGDSVLKQCIEDYYTAGMGVMMPYVDPIGDDGRPEICVRSVDPLDVFIDPNSRDPFCRDAAHILIARPYTHEQLVRAYPQYAELIEGATPIAGDTRRPVGTGLGQQAQGSAMQPTEYYHVKYDVIDRYSKIRAKRYHVYHDDGNMEKVLKNEEYKEYLDSTCFVEESQSGVKYITNDAEIMQAGEIYQQYGGMFHYGVNPQDPQSQPQMLPGGENQQTDAQQGMETIPNSTVRLTPVKAFDLVSQKIIQVDEVPITRIERVFSIGNKLCYQGTLEIDEYPLAIMMNRWERNPYPMSDVRLVRPLQKYINRIRSLIIAHATNSTNLKVFYPRGGVDPKVLKEEVERAGVGLIPIDSETGNVQFGQPIPLPNELYKNEADARRDIQEILGIYSLAQGDPQSSQETYKGTVAMDEYGQRRIKSKKDDIEQALNLLAKVIAEMIPQVYTEYRVIRIVKPNNASKLYEINKSIFDDNSGELRGKLNDITVGKYDIVFVSGSTLPVNRWARFEYYKQLYEMQVIDQEELLKQTEVVDIEGVMERMSIIRQLQQQLMQATEEIKSLKGDLQTAQRESVHAQQRVEVEKFKAGVKTAGNKIDMASQLFDARLKDNLKTHKEQQRLAARNGAKTQKGK